MPIPQRPDELPHDAAGRPGLRIVVVVAPGGVGPEVPAGAPLESMGRRRRGGVRVDRGGDRRCGIRAASAANTTPAAVVTHGRGRSARLQRIAEAHRCADAGPRVAVGIVVPAGGISIASISHLPSSLVGQQRGVLLGLILQGKVKLIIL